MNSLSSTLTKALAMAVATTAALGGFPSAARAENLTVPKIRRHCRCDTRF